MAVSNTFLFKPRSDTTGNLVVLTPNTYNNRIGQVELLDSKGNVVEQGRFSNNTHNGARGHFRFSKPGSAYGDNVSVRINFDDGTEAQTINVGAGGNRYEQNFSGQGAVSSPTVRQGEGTTSPSVQTGPGGQDFVMPGAVDYTGLQAPYVDYMSAIGLAQSMGQQARESFFENIGRAGEAALDVVGTDIAGIQQGLDAMLPRARTEGEQDLQTNINRARAIDQANLNRIGQFNEFNIAEADEANRYNAAMFNEAIDASGIDYRRRSNELLDQLEQTSRTGNLGTDFDEAFNIELGNRGSEIAAASGSGPVSGAGLRASERFMASEKANMALGARNVLLSALPGFQQTLQYQPTRFQPLQAQPTQIPLNAADFANRIPITSSISAGATQTSLGQAATNLEVIPATGVLSSALNTAQYNENARYGRDLTVMDRTQSQLTAEGNAIQGAINQDYAAQLRDQQNEAYLEGLRIRQRSEQRAAEGTAAGMVQGVTGTTPGVVSTPGTVNASPLTPTGGVNSGTTIAPTQGGGARISTGNPVLDGVINGDYSTVVQDIAGTIDSGAQWIDKTFGDNDGVLTVGNTEISGRGFNQMLNDAWSYFTGDGKDNLSNTSINGQGIVGSAVDADGNAGYMLEDGSDFFGDPESINNQKVVDTSTAANGAKIYKTDGGELYTPLSATDPRYSELESSGVKPMNTQQNLDANPFVAVTKPVTDLGVDYKMLSQTAGMVQNWERMSPSQQLSSSTDIGFGLLENHGIIDPQEARLLRRGADSLSIFMNPDSTDAQRSSALTGLISDVATTPFTGSPDAPTSINGLEVVSSGDIKGKPVFNLEDGSTVPQSEILNSYNTANVIRSFSVLMSGADKDTKARALMGTGVNAAVANGLVDQVAGGNLLAGLSLFNTSANWQDMNSVQRAVSVMNTSGSVLNAAAANGMIPTSNTGSGLLSYTSQTSNVLGGSSAAIGGLYTAYKGVEQAADVIDAVSDMPQSQAVSEGAAGLATSGAMIGGGLTAAAVGIGTAAGMAATGAAIGTAAVPLIGTLIGAGVGAIAGVVAGSTGSGKNTGQIMRDGWRGAMIDNGFASKDPEGDVFVTLADGTKYNIGLDGNAKLPNKGVNKDGEKERNTFDVDWSNQAAVDSIPNAHLFAIATGLDPTSGSDMDLFHRGVAQSLNAASSNTDTVEGIQSNFKSMMDGAGVDPRHLAMRVETLRNTNAITEDEYGTYINSINNMYGTQLKTTDKETSTNKLLTRLNATPPDKISKYDRELAQLLTNPKALAKAEKSLQKRISKEQSNLGKRLEDVNITPSMLDKKSRVNIPTNLPGMEAQLLRLVKNGNFSTRNLNV